MKGRQLVSIKVNKAKALSMYSNPIGYIQGISEDIQHISPRDRKFRNQIYLKSISPNMPLIHKSSASKTSSLTSSMRFHSNGQNGLHSKTFMAPSKKNKDKIFKLDPNSRFSLHYRQLEEKQLSKLNEELFPQEFIENIEYLPDYTPSILQNHIELDTTRRSKSQETKSGAYKISNILKSRNDVKRIDMGKLDKSKFTTYSTGWDSFYMRTPAKTPRKYNVRLSNLLPVIAQDIVDEKNVIA